MAAWTSGGHPHEHEYFKLHHIFLKLASLKMVLTTFTKLIVSLLLVNSLGLVSAVAYAQSPQPFVDRDFDVPQQLETESFRIRMLTVNDVVKDYDAVISSAEHLKAIWPDSGWPDGLTLEQNLIDLGWHQKEFQRRSSFAYTVVTLDETRVIGCVYIYPTRKNGYDAEVYFWRREGGMDSPADAKLHAAVKTWLAETWPFENVAFPGRSIDWKDWKSTRVEKR